MAPPTGPPLPIATCLLSTSGLELLTFPTTNGHKPAMFLEELTAAYPSTVKYTAQTISLPDRVQKQSWYIALNPQGKVPVVVDHDRGFNVTECATILSYLARVYDTEHQFSFSDEIDSLKCEQWLSFAQGDLSPASSTCAKYYRFLPARHAFGIAQSHREMLRLYGVLDAALAGRDYLAGQGKGMYSIADMTCWTHVVSSVFIGIGTLERWGNLERWCEAIATREAIKRAMKVPFVREYGNGAMVKLLAEGGGFAKGEEGLQRALKSALGEFPDA